MAVHLDNPAGRLADIMGRFNDVAADGKVRVDAAWLKVLGDSRPLAVNLAAVAGVLADVAKAVENLDDPDSQELFAHYHPYWAETILQPNQPLNQQLASNLAFETGGLLSLRQLSSTMHRTMSEGNIGSAEDMADVRTSVSSAIDALRIDNELPADLKKVIYARLIDIMFALDQFRFVGPSGVLGSTERLVGALAMRPKAEGKWSERASVKKAVMAAFFAYSVFSAGPDVLQSLQAWDQLSEYVLPEKAESTDQTSSPTEDTDIVDADVEETEEPGQ